MLPSSLLLHVSEPSCSCACPALQPNTFSYSALISALARAGLWRVRSASPAFSQLLPQRNGISGTCRIWYLLLPPSLP